MLHAINKLTQKEPVENATEKGRRSIKKEDSEHISKLLVEGERTKEGKNVKKSQEEVVKESKNTKK